MTTNEIVCVGEYALKRQESFWQTQTIIAYGSGNAEKLAHERKTLGLTLASLNLHWQIFGRPSKLSRVSCGVNPGLDMLIESCVTTLSGDTTPNKHDLGVIKIVKYCKTVISDKGFSRRSS